MFVWYNITDNKNKGKMVMLMLKYSVLMSEYKKENPEFLRLSMQSIFDQTVKTDDFVLICDGPLGKELNLVIEDFQNRYGDILNIVRFEKNRGLGPALNDGLRICKNELVARMDSDDFAPEKRIELQLGAFERDNSLDIVGGAIEEFEGEPKNVISKKDMPISHEEILKYARLRNPFNHPTVMYKRDTVLKVGGYVPLYLYEDYGLWVKLLNGGARALNLSDTLCCMRVDGGLYGRRGGLKYLGTALRFRRYLYKTKFNSIGQMLYSSAVLIIVCIIPTWFRKFIYRTFLRDKKQ